MSRPSDPTGRVFDALADPTRRRVVRALAESGPSSATELAAGFPVTRQAVVKHLQALREAGLVEAEPRGRERRYRLTLAPLADATAWMDEVGGRWDERLASLERLLHRRHARDQ